MIYTLCNVVDQQDLLTICYNRLVCLDSQVLLTVMLITCILYCLSTKLVISVYLETKQNKLSSVQHINLIA